MLTAIKEAARRINLPCCSVATTEEANSSYRTGRHYLILLETRPSHDPSHDYDPASVTKAIRQSTGGEYAVIVGIVRRHLLDKEELLVLPHLNNGMDRIVCESVSRVGWTNELLQLVRGPVTTAFRLRHTQSLFTALDNVRDIVQVTDSDHKVTWVNQAAEKSPGSTRLQRRCWASQDPRWWGGTFGNFTLQAAQTMNRLTIIPLTERAILGSSPS